MLAISNKGCIFVLYKTGIIPITTQKQVYVLKAFHSHYDGGVDAAELWNKESNHAQEMTFYEWCKLVENETDEDVDWIAYDKDGNEIEY